MKNTYKFLVNGETALNEYANTIEEAIDIMLSNIYIKVEPKYRFSLLANNYVIRYYDNNISHY